MSFTRHGAKLSAFRFFPSLLLGSALAMPACRTGVRDYEITAGVLDGKDETFKKKIEDAKLSKDDKKLLHG